MMIRNIAELNHTVRQEATETTRYAITERKMLRGLVAASP